MITEQAAAQIAATDHQWLYRWGGLSSVLLSLGYIGIIPLYIYTGPPPSGGETRLQYFIGKADVWWAILGLSVLTDLLFLPVVLALYRALKDVNRNAILLATTLVGLFVVLDLAVTWTNYAALITLSEHYATATSDIQRAADVGAATYASAVLESSLESVYSILILSVGILTISLVMRKGIFGTSTAYIGIVTGVLGIVAAVGPLFVSALSITIVIVSALTTLWILLVGFRLFRLGRR
jgi:hypothetical protein